MVLSFGGASPGRPAQHAQQIPAIQLDDVTVGQETSQLEAASAADRA
jgi:hypothetical protein